jgi:hypothetical protein
MPDAIWKKICWPIFNPGTVREMVGCRNPNYNAAVNEVNDDEGTTSTRLNANWGNMGKIGNMKAIFQ